MTRSWEVPHPPGIKAYDFFIDGEEIKRDTQERRFLNYVQRQREQYASAN